MPSSSRAWRWFLGLPKGSELLVGTLGAVTEVSGRSIAESIAGGWVIAGVVSVEVQLGPVKSCAVATGSLARLGEFYDAIDRVGRLVVTVAAAAVILCVDGLEVVPGSSELSLGDGGLPAVVVVVAIKLIRHRERGS